MELFKYSLMSTVLLERIIVREENLAIRITNLHGKLSTLILSLLDVLFLNFVFFFVFFFNFSFKTIKEF